MTTETEEYRRRREILAKEFADTAAEKLGWSNDGVKTFDEIDQTIEEYATRTGRAEDRRVEKALQFLPYIKHLASRLLERVNEEILKSKGNYCPWHVIHQEELLEAGTLFGLKTRKLDIDWSYLHLAEVIDIEFKVFTKIHTHREALMVTLPETDVAQPLICLVEISSPITRQKIQRIFDLGSNPNEMIFWSESTLTEVLYEVLKRLKSPE